MTDGNGAAEIRDTVEEIARNAERECLKRSPFHLSPCGGCGAPSFQQPCPLCGYYPMGTHRGTWSPRTASFGQFAEMVERSGPHGKNGTLATWHARSFFTTVAPQAADAEEAVIERAARLDVATAEAAWKAVAEEGASFTREPAPACVSDGWTAFGELTSRTAGTPAAEAARKAAASWTAAAHAEDAAGMAEALEAGGTACAQALGMNPRDGNLRMAAETFDRALAAVVARVTPKP